jgi:threonine aldolase
VAPAQTNMVFATVPAERAAALAAHLKQNGVIVLPGARLRLVTHLDVDRAGIERAIAALRSFFAA